MAGIWEPNQVESLFKAFQEAKLPSPPTDCLAPIGVRQMLAGMLKGVKAGIFTPPVLASRKFIVAGRSRSKLRSHLAASLLPTTVLA